mmetsp:Transcript_1088/g.2401  ORF Transcript_1088/g.2401 Transcript_1088/m.2401 type:complete len:103 (-) Transcript_1088:1677-1985(-)
MAVEYAGRPSESLSCILYSANHYCRHSCWPRKILDTVVNLKNDEQIGNTVVTVNITSMYLSHSRTMNQGYFFRIHLHSPRFQIPQKFRNVHVIHLLLRKIRS